MSWAADKAANINITASRMDTDSNDFTTGINTCLAKDGQNSPSANLPMASFKHTGVSTSSGSASRSEYAATAIVQDGAVVYTAASGTDTYTANLSPAITSYVDGAEYNVNIANPNATTTPTLALNGMAAKTIVRPDDSALIAGDLNGAHHFRRDTTNDVIRVLNPRKLKPADLVNGTATAAVTWSAAQAMSGAAINEAAVSIASAATVNLGAAAGNYVTITGNTGPITSFGNSVQGGARRRLTFASNPQITASSSLIIPGVSSGNNLIVSAADSLEVEDEGSNVWRVTSYTPAAGQAVSTATEQLGSLKNKIMNGGATVAQRSAPNLSTSFQYGAVDRFLVAATAGTVSAGTIAQDTSSPAGRTGRSLKVAGVTTTGGACTISAKQRIESVDAATLKNQIGSVSLRVYHDTGSAINYQITLRKPTAADNYTSTTQIAQSSTISVASATDTLITFANQSLGDCSNGLEVQADAIVGGNVTTKNFSFTEWQVEEGPVVTAFERRPVSQELRDCQRYLEIVTLAEQSSFGASAATFAWSQTWAVPKRATPSVALSGTASWSTVNCSFTSFSATQTGFVASFTASSSAGTFAALTPGTGGILATAEL